MQQKSFFIEPMFTFKNGNKIMFTMSNETFYLTEDEIAMMEKGGSPRDEIFSYVFQLLSKKRFSDFSGIKEVFDERVHG